MKPLKPLSLPSPAREELRSLFQSRAKLSPVCRAVAGLEGTSQQALQRSCAVRRVFASSFAAVKRKAPCSQIKLQMVSGSPVPSATYPSPPPGRVISNLPWHRPTARTSQRRKLGLTAAKTLGHSDTAGE